MASYFSNTKISFGRSVWSYNIIQWLVGTLIRGRRLFMDFKTEGLILDVGCGPNGNSRNINLDYSWRPGVDICCDITKGLPLEANYVGGIYSEHCIEHISFDAALSVFREFYRIMKPGAYIRIVVPDFEIYVDRYDQFRKTGELSMPHASLDVRADGIYTPAISVNRVFRSWGHQFIYDFSTMHAMLNNVGFIDITKTCFGRSADQSLILDSPDRTIESLYVEARKPY